LSLFWMKKTSAMSIKSDWYKWIKTTFS
jgi:hypothetical protein